MIEQELIMSLTVIIHLVVIETDGISFSFVIVENHSIWIVCPVIFQLFFTDTIPSMISLFLSAEGDKLNRRVFTEISALYKI